MAGANLQSLRALLERIAPRLKTGAEIQCKPFFGGAAAYADGRIFMTLTSVGLALKLPEFSRTAWLDRGARPLRYFPKGPIKKDYVLLPESAENHPDDLAPSVEESIRFVQGLPVKRKAKSAPSVANR
ncbi:MAG: TfoX/Sxy family protein [SAR324 cluster bacterium]|nr:TfoX/Sxy family protein [SAR324 cluster bacterium]